VKPVHWQTWVSFKTESGSRKKSIAACEEYVGLFFSFLITRF
jgi:hypothetical protein